MKTSYLFLTISLVVSLFACQSTDEFGVSDNEITIEGANKKLSFRPNGVEDIKVAGQSVRIDFSQDEFMAEAITYEGDYRDNGQIIEGDLFKTFPTLGKLASYYDRTRLSYNSIFDSWINFYSGEIIYPSLEYVLAQECFQDNCPTEMRKVILQMALNKHELKTHDLYLLSSSTRRTGMFLMAVILVKEKDAGFLAAVRENRDIQNALRLNLDEESELSILRSSTVDSEICQFAENFLSQVN